MYLPHPHININSINCSLAIISCMSLIPLLFLSGIDECSEGTHNCNVLAACTDTPYAFRCTCYAGYTGNGVACNGRILDTVMK